jgi:four helix bundle protein
MNSDSKSNSDSKELFVVEKAKHLCKDVYEWVNITLPEKEKFGLWSQITRSVVSVPSNIVEGQQRSDGDFLRFITIARGSLQELKIQLDIAFSIYPQNHRLFCDIKNQIEEIGKMSYRLYQKVQVDARADAGVKR